MSRCTCQRKITCVVHAGMRPTPQMVREALFSILGNAVPGRVFYQGATGEQTLLQATTGRIYNVAVGPDGVIYLSDANTNDLLRWSGGKLTLVHSHTTYLRDVAFDPRGASTSARHRAQALMVGSTGWTTAWRPCSIRCRSPPWGD